jgi:hypothetical protein
MLAFISYSAAGASSNWIVTAIMMAQIVDLGNTRIMLPMAAVIAARLVSGRAWRQALCWCLMFAIGLSMVALSKIAFLGWQIAIPLLHFDALSGHAFRAAAVIPVFIFIALQRTSFLWRARGVAFGIAFSAGLAVLLVRFRFHTVSEVIASLMLGSLISLGFIRIATRMPPPTLDRATVPFCLIIFILIFALNPSTLSHRLVDIALYLSGRDHPYVWSRNLAK